MAAELLADCSQGLADFVKGIWLVKLLRAESRRSEPGPLGFRSGRSSSGG